MHIRSLLILQYDNRIVESTDARLFGLTDAVVQERRRYVKHVKSEIEVSNRISVEAFGQS